MILIFKVLKPDTIDEFMPKTSYCDLYDNKSKHKFYQIKIKWKEKVAGETCSVCLLEFEEFE